MKRQAEPTAVKNYMLLEVLRCPRVLQPKPSAAQNPRKPNQGKWHTSRMRGVPNHVMKTTNQQNQVLETMGQAENGTSNQSRYEPRCVERDAEQA